METQNTDIQLFFFSNLAASHKFRYVIYSLLFSSKYFLIFVVISSLSQIFKELFLLNFQFRPFYSYRFIVYV